MRKCYYSRQYTIYSCVNLICGLLIGSVVILLGVFLSELAIVWRCVLLALGVAAAVYFGAFAAFLVQKYDLNEKGITVQYAHRNPVFYSWEAIRFVCVCVTHRSGTGITQDTVILCTTKKPGRPFSADARLRTGWEYDFFHRNSVITVEYNDERMEEFGACYPGEIHDYR